MKHETPSSGYLSGQLLVAMPAMRDPRFARSVIYMCAHSSEGAMGLVINRLVGSISFTDLMQQLGIETDGRALPQRVHFGGPVETTRGFVLHSTDRLEEGSLRVDDDTALTSTTDILRAIAAGEGPRQSLLALGYAGWGPGQLDAELQANAWLSVTPDADLVFGAELDAKWERSLGKLGISLAMLSGEAGHA